MQSIMVDNKTIEDYRLFRQYVTALKTGSPKKILKYDFLISKDNDCPNIRNGIDIVKFATRAQGEAKIRLKEYIFLKQMNYQNRYKSE